MATSARGLLMLLGRACARPANVRRLPRRDHRCVDGTFDLLLRVKGAAPCELAEARLYEARAGLARARATVAAARAAYLAGEYSVIGGAARAAYYASLEALDLAEETLPLRRGEAHIARCRVERWTQ